MSNKTTIYKDAEYSRGYFLHDGSTTLKMVLIELSTVDAVRIHCINLLNTTTLIEASDDDAKILKGLLNSKVIGIDYEDLTDNHDFIANLIKNI